ncbi:hypothetical protein VitviT2T_024006 [Vitis vinifera]|uniref:Uncharacterized protein n=1 Tax=Vitis vinifera TaxID=29760 RepID=A0ABY9DEE2_VITVI|nr:hypothetical protein VitviT2T_024006 [Vitis vinifera]
MQTCDGYLNVKLEGASGNKSFAWRELFEVRKLELVKENVEDPSVVLGHEYLYLFHPLLQVPLPLFGGSGNYVSALYISAVKANALHIVESEIVDFVEASNRSKKFSEFMKNLSVPRDARVKAVAAILSETKFSDVTKNFLGFLSKVPNLRLEICSFLHFLVALFTLSITIFFALPLPPQEEKELKETLQDIIGHGKKVKLEQRLIPVFLVEFDQKMFDMSIKTRAREMERFLRDPINFDSL